MARPDIFTIPEALQPYGRMLRVHGLNLHCYASEGGSATPLLLVHGLGDEADTWRHIFGPLAARGPVFAPDLPGFGRSDRPARAYTLAFFARTLEELLRELGLARVVLVGSSLGAAVVQRLTLARPELVERLVLIGGALPIVARLPVAQQWLFLTPGLGELIYTGLRRSQQQAYDTLRPYYADLEALPEADRAFLWQRVWARVWSDGQRRAFLSTYRWLQIDAQLRANWYRQRVAATAVPTQLLWGEHDTIVPRTTGEAMAALVPGTQLEWIAGSGHLPQQEQPAALLAAISRG